MEIKISGLKCDTFHCNYINDDVKFEDYINHINSFCPICHSNLLTQEDYNKYLKMYNLVEKWNKIENVIKYLNPFYWFNKNKKQDLYNLKVKFENDGTKTTKITKEEK